MSIPSFVRLALAFTLVGSGVSNVASARFPNQLNFAVGDDDLRISGLSASILLGAVAVGDWNSDGFADIAMGYPGNSSLGRSHNGTVYIFYGSASPSPTLSPANAGTVIHGANGARAGTSLAFGDFNGDHRQDLAIGSPLGAHDVSGGSIPGVGTVHVIYGRSGGQHSSYNLQANLGFEALKLYGGPNNAHWGRAVALGDLDADGKDDLATACDTFSFFCSGGMVALLPGIAFGDSVYDPSEPHLTFISTGGLGHTINSAPIALAFGNIDGDGFTDLLIGDALVEHGPRPAVGSIFAVYGRATAFGMSIDLCSHPSGVTQFFTMDDILLGRSVA